MCHNELAGMFINTMEGIFLHHLRLWSLEPETAGRPLLKRKCSYNIFNDWVAQEGDNKIIYKLAHQCVSSKNYLFCFSKVQTCKV